MREPNYRLCEYRRDSTTKTKRFFFQTKEKVTNLLEVFHKDFQVFRDSFDDLKRKTER